MADIRDGGLLAEFEDVTALAHACEKVRDAGFKRWDVYSPFPIHGIDPRIGIKPTKIPWLIFFAGITGTTTAMAMQWWTNALDYQFMISGKPFWSIPANVPVGFELTVLFSAITAFIATLGVNGLPRLYTPLFNSERFQRVTDDKVFLAIESRDKKYDAAATKELLTELGAVHIEHIEDDSHVNAALPGTIKWVAAVLVSLSFVPLGLIVKARSTFSDQPQIHVFPDMDFQPKFKAQTANDLFADGRAMRLPEAGTIAVGDLATDEHLHGGVDGSDWAKTLPAQVPFNEATLDRGEERFGIYCTPCHGEAGYGDGMVHRRAEKIGSAKWVAPTSLHEGYVREQPVGKLFHTITHGIRNMPSYGHAIPVEDRWAIVAYIKALQLSQGAPAGDLPASARAKLQ